MKLAALMLSLAAVAAQPVRPPIASSPIVTVEGKVKKVQIAMGEGMPYMELQNGADVTRVFLGPVRFLMTENFNPKAGTEMKVTGYKVNQDVVAISITIPSEKRTLKLRDADGFPVWHRGMMGRMGR